MDGELIQVVLGSNEQRAIESKNEMDENITAFWPVADPEILVKLSKTKSKDTVNFLFIAIDLAKDAKPYKEVIEKYFQSWQKSNYTDNKEKENDERDSGVLCGKVGIG